MDVRASLPLLEALALELPAPWITAALARRRSVLSQLLEEERGGDGWDACQALRLAHLWLVAGVPGLGDDLVLEAADLAPAAGVIPDWWGLWPAAEASGAEPARALALSYLQLRHQPPLAAWQEWSQLVLADGGLHRLQEPAVQLLLGIVLHGREWLPEPLEPVLARIVGEEVVAAEPALAWRFYDPLSERLPEWEYALLKAADLSLQRGELERCGAHIQRGLAVHGHNPWVHDIAARLALAQGDVEAALACWQQAITLCAAMADDVQAQLVELFRQRAREARRGPGVLQARALINRGESEAARQLLEALLEQDPQWQPLRSLLEPLRGEAPGPARGDGSASSELDRLEQRLRLLADRAGLAWPGEAPEAPGDAAGWERHLQQALGRLALLG